MSIDKMAEAIVHDTAERTSLPPTFAPSPLSEIVVLSDLWSPIGEVQRTIAQLSATGAHGHVVQIVDPAEETFPYSGRVEFVEPEGAGSITAGRAETWRNDYSGAGRTPSRRDPRRDRPARLELHHPPHRPAGQRIAAGAASRIGAKAQSSALGSGRAPAAGAARMMGAAARFRPAAGADRPAQPAGAVVAAAAGAAAPAPHHFPADAAPVRDRAEGRDARAHAVVADAVALDACRAIIIAAAGPLWNPPLAHRTRRSASLVMLDDGWAAAATWDERLRTAEELLARAEADNRGVAVLPLSETARDISLQPPAPRACSSGSSSPSRTASIAPRRCR